MSAPMLTMAFRGVGFLRTWFVGGSGACGYKVVRFDCRLLIYGGKVASTMSVGSPTSSSPITAMARYFPGTSVARGLRMPGGRGTISDLHVCAPGGARECRTCCSQLRSHQCPFSWDDSRGSETGERNAVHTCTLPIGGASIGVCEFLAFDGERRHWV